MKAPIERAYSPTANNGGRFNRYRDFARNLTLSTLSFYYRAADRMSAGLSSNRIQIVCLHHVNKNEESAFRAVLRALKINHRFISYSEAVDRILEGRIDAPYVAFSFDDGLQSCMRAAFVLEEFDVRGCFFVCPSILDETDRSKKEEFCLNHLGIAPTGLLSWKDVEILLRDGHEIGSHAMSHRMLTRLSAADMQAEIEKSYDVLGEKLGTIAHFAWPYGRFNCFNAAAARAVFKAGFRSCASLVRGCHIAAAKDSSHLCIRRDHLVANWPINHILYFIARNGLDASVKNNFWPVAWNM
jgi:peptidoglycan/xylan/chitin deacetylase (PgdA/CDA1 family)